MNNDREQSSTVGLAAALGALLSWSLGPILIKYLTGHFDAWTQNVYRYLAASLFLFPVLWRAYRRGELPAGLWRRALVPSAFNVVMQSFWASGFYYLNPAFMSLINQSSVFWITLISLALFPEERVFMRRPFFWIGLGMAVAGAVGVILSRPDFSVTGTAKGIVYTLCASATWACYAVSSRVAFRRVATQQGFAMVCVQTLVGLAVVSAVWSNPFRGLPTEPYVWGWLVLSAIVAITLAHTCYFAAMKRLGTTIPAVLMLLVPLGVLLISRVIFGESLTRGQWIGGAVLVVGSLLATLSRRQ